MVILCSVFAVSPADKPVYVFYKSICTSVALSLGLHSFAHLLALLMSFTRVI